MAPTTTPEFGALVALCRGFRDITDHQVSLDGLDQRLLYALAVRHRVEGAAWAGLARLRGNGVDETMFAALEEDRREQARNYLVQTGETLRLVGLLESAGHAVIVLKGCALANDLYAPNPELRQSVDMDLLVAPSSFAAADNALRREGYLRETPGMELPAGADSMARFLLNAWEYTHPSSGLKVELHHRPLASPYTFAVSFEDLLSRSRRVKIGGAAIRVPGLDDLAVYLCCHAAGHVFFRLKWVLDIGLLFDRVGAEGVGRALERASKLGCERQVLATLDVLGRLGWHAGGVASRPSDPASRWFEDRALVALTEPARDGPEFRFADVRADIREMVYCFRLASGWRAKAFVVLQHLSNQKDLTTLGLGSNCVALYALLGRPLALGRWIRRGFADKSAAPRGHLQ